MPNVFVQKENYKLIRNDKVFTDTTQESIRFAVPCMPNVDPVGGIVALCLERYIAGLVTVSAGREIKL